MIFLKFGKNIVLFFSVLIALISAGCNYSYDKPGQESSDSERMVPLSGDGKADLFRICNALKIKRANIEKLNDREGRVTLRTSKRDCGDPQTFDLGTFPVELRITQGKPPFFEAIPSGRRMLSSVQTDTYGSISAFCLPLNNGEEVSNEITVDEGKLRIEFKTDGDFDQYILTKSTINIYTNESLYSETEKGSVYTSRTTSDSDFMGILKRRHFSTPCPNGEIETFTQTFEKFD